ncbi:hypothetical protein Trydic_g6783 [Trypoxylus dichotomus]
MATRTASKTTPDMERTSTSRSTSTDATEKTKLPTTVLFAIGGRRRRRYGNAPELTSQGGIIPWQREVKYLRITLRFPGKLGSQHTPRARPRTSDVGNPLSDDGGTREARSLKVTKPSLGPP